MFVLHPHHSPFSSNWCCVTVYHIVILLHYFYMCFPTQSLSTSGPVANAMLQAASVGSLPEVQQLVKLLVNVEDKVSRNKFTEVPYSELGMWIWAQLGRGLKETQLG